MFGTIEKGKIMKRFTFRIDIYTYEKFKIMAKYFGISLNSLILELAQIGYLVREKEIINRGDIKNEK